MFSSGCYDYAHSCKKVIQLLACTTFGGAYTISSTQETNISIEYLGSFFVCSSCSRNSALVVDGEQGKQVHQLR
jgi:hypothetical protein